MSTAETSITETSITEVSVTSSALPLPGDHAPRVAAARLRAPSGHGAGVAHADDGALLALARHGDRNAFGALVERHHRMLAGLIRQRLGPHEPVEDLLQEVFAKALSSLDGFGGRSSFATWAGSIAINLSIDWQRKQARRRRLAPTANVAHDTVPQPDSARSLRSVEVREEAELARAAIERLPLRMRLAVTLRVVEELPYETVAARLDAPVATVRTWVSRGLKTVRAALEVHDDDSR